MVVLLAALDLELSLILKEDALRRCRCHEVRQPWLMISRCSVNWDVDDDPESMDVDMDDFGID